MISVGERGHRFTIMVRPMSSARWMRLAKVRCHDVETGLATARRIEIAKPAIIGLDASARHRFGCKERTALRELTGRSIRLPEDRGRERCTLGACGK